MRMNLWDAVMIAVVSAMPIVELRGGIPLALSRGASPIAALSLALLGNLIVVPVLLWGLEWMESLLMRWTFTRAIMEWVFARSRRKGRWVERWGVVGLLLLVAIPLPGTGAWTGALAARLLGIPNRRSLPWIVLGVLIAGTFVLFASLGVIHLFGLQPAV